MRASAWPTAYAHLRALFLRYEMMQLCRQFENACNQAYMQGNIRGFMHLDNGQESIPAMLADFINKDDIK